MGLTTTDLLACSPDAIDAVAFSWERLSGAMAGDEATVDREVIAPLRDGGWVSKDGDRAIQLIGWVGDQLQALHRESAAMASILREAAGELRSAQNELRAIMDEVRLNGMTFDPDGSINWPKVVDTQQDQMSTRAHAYLARITAVLQRATDADALAAETMRKNTDSIKNKLDFNVGSLAADPAADGVRSAMLLEKLQRGEPLSAQELQLLKLLGQDNAGDANYHTTLLRTLTPATLLAVTQTTSTDQPWLVKGQSPEDLAFIQNTLRQSLSLASGELAKDGDWMKKLAEASRNVNADKQHPLSGFKTYGFQNLQTLLQQGTYDPKFLNLVGDDLLEYDKELTARGTGWGTDTKERDPVTGFMTTLKNNPTAANEFFGGADGKQDLRYLADQRKPQSHLDPLGGALAAAGKTAPGSPATLDVLSNTVSVLGDSKSSALEHSAGLRNGVTQMLVANPGTLHAGLSNDNPGVAAVSMPPGLPSAAVDRDFMQRVVGDLVVDAPNAGALQHAQQIFTVAGLTAIAEGNTGTTPEELRIRDEKLKNFTQNAAESFGAINERVNADIRKDQLTGDKAQNEIVARSTRWGGGFLAAVATVLPKIPEGVGDFVAVGITQGAEEINQSLQRDTSGAATREMNQTYVDHLRIANETVLEWQNSYNSNPSHPPINVVDEVDKGFVTGRATSSGAVGSG